MQPEISQRCSSCGAAIREPAMFCPECGQSLAPTSAPQSTAAKSETNEAQPEPQGPSAPAVEEAAPAPARETHRPEPIAAAVGDASVKQTDTAAATENPGTVERTREKLQRASSAARGALEENVKRVDKIRHASTAVFEEASYDPSLRFVLVALGLFVVALILLVLSKFMG